METNDERINAMSILLKHNSRTYFKGLEACLTRTVDKRITCMKYETLVVKTLECQKRSV